MRPENLIRFPTGSVVRSVYSDKVYKIAGHSSNGMSRLLLLRDNSIETWNACNNTHFVPADFVGIGILVSLL